LDLTSHHLAGGADPVLQRLTARPGLERAPGGAMEIDTTLLYSGSECGSPTASRGSEAAVASEPADLLPEGEENCGAGDRRRDRRDSRRPAGAPLRAPVAGEVKPCATACGRLTDRPAAGTHELFRPPSLEGSG
jgi:hypothetical protein